jgi:hypothetical protein
MDLLGRKPPQSYYDKRKKQHRHISSYPRIHLFNLRIEPVYADIFTNTDFRKGRYYPIVTPLHILPDGFVRNYLTLGQHRLKNRFLLIEYLSKSPFIGTFESRNNASKRRAFEKKLHLNSEEYYSQLYEAVCYAHMLEYRLRSRFRKLFLQWRLRSIDKKYEPMDDPITFEPPVKPVIIYDHKVYRKFVYDARSLNRAIYANMTTQIYSFPEPQMPKNTYTNAPFSYAQLVSVYSQLLKHGEMTWVLSTFRYLRFTFERWKSYVDPFLVLHAIRSELTDIRSSTGQEMLYDFIYSRAQSLGIHLSSSILKLYRCAIRYAYDCDIIVGFRSLAVRYYEANHFNLSTIALITSGCKNLFLRHDSLVIYMNKHNIRY